MAQQSSLCYKDLTLRHFIVSQTSVRRARVINWKSVCTMLCGCVQYVEIYTKRRASANRIDFCFHLKKIAAELYWLLREAYGEYVPSKDTCERWFGRFKSGYLEVADEHGKPSKNSKIWNCKLWYTRMIRKHKKQFTVQLGVSQKVVPIGYERWERFRSPVDGYHMSWTTDKWKNAKTHVTFCSFETKRSGFCIVQLQGMKSGFILRILSAKIMDRPRRIIHIGRKIESLGQKYDALCLMKPERRGLLWAVKTWGNG